MLGHRSYVPVHVIAPTPPDVYTCDIRYGSGLDPETCARTAGILPQGQSAVPYLLNAQGVQFSLPISIQYGPCMISVEVANPSGESISQIVAVPDSLRGMAGWIINRCVAATGGIGGFSTLAIQNLVNYVNNPDTDISAPYAWDVAFITLAVTNLRDTKPSPGEYDPLVPILLFDSLITSSEEAPRGSALQQSFRSKAYSFYFAISDAQRGAMTPWWRAA